MLRELADGYRVPEGQPPSKAVITLSPSDIEEAEKIAKKLGGEFRYETGKGRGGSVPVGYLIDMLDAEVEFDKQTQERIEAATKSILEEQQEEQQQEEPAPAEPTPPPPRRSVPQRKPAGA